MDTDALKKSLLKKFQEVTGDRLQKIQLGVLELGKPEAGHATDDVARELHTMKGEARMLGLSAMGQLSHAIEDVLKAFREGKQTAQATTDLILQACDVLSELLEDPAGAAIIGNESSQKMCEDLSKASGHPVPKLSSTPSAHSFKPPAARPPPAATAAPAAKPPAPPPEQTTAAPAFKDTPPQTTPGVTRQVAPDRTIRVNIEILDTLGLVAGDLLVESARAKLRTEELDEILQRFSRVGDRMMRLGEGIRARSEPEARAYEQMETDLHLLRDDAFRFVRRNMDGLNTLHGNLAMLADNVAQARLVPLSTVFEVFPRAVRDIAKQLGKQVDLTVERTDVGVDRSMVSDIRDALVHILRNAVDHGIEDADFRTAMGKAAGGRITIRVRVNGDMLHIDVADDGRGMDPERLRKSAIAKQLVNAQQAAMLSEREVIELVFMPGFSTRDEVSDLSGRGVGMDVVKRKVEALAGSVSISSKMGMGTTIHLRLPQSLALMKVLLIRLHDDVYGIPTADVESVMRIKPEDRVEVFGTLAVRYREKPISLVALGPLLALNGGPRFDQPPVVIVRHGEDRAALVVDGFVDEREVAVKPCGGDFLKGAPFVGGAASLEDGRVAVLLHVPDIMGEVRRLVRPVAQQPSQKRLRVLLVDDSPIARATESALVRALGHSVEEAQDGEEGFAMARAATYDLILTDVQMPKLDGFSLTRRLKADPSFAKLPVIILSSLASPEDRRRGLDAGADAYLVKGELGIESLAHTIDRLT